MAKQFYRRSNVEQRREHHNNLGWKVLWETRTPAEGGSWSLAHEGTEADAIERARHLVRLGFVVHSVLDPSGATALDAAQIAERLAPA